MRKFTVSQVAREISRRTGRTIPPHTISNLFYRRQLDDLRCPIVGRVRLIPEDYLPVIERVVLDSIDQSQTLPPVDDTESDRAQ